MTDFTQYDNAQLAELYSAASDAVIAAAQGIIDNRMGSLQLPYPSPESALLDAQLPILKRDLAAAQAILAAVKAEQDRRAAAAEDEWRDILAAYRWEIADEAASIDADCAAADRADQEAFERDILAAYRWEIANTDADRHRAQWDATAAEHDAHMKRLEDR